MGVHLSIPAVQGLVTNTGVTPHPPIATSYAFAAGNSGQFGATATFSFGANPTITAAVPTLGFTGRDGRFSEVQCNPTMANGSGAPITTSLLCPVANSAFGPGTAQIYISGFSNSFFFSVTTQITQVVSNDVTITSTITPTVTATSVPSTTTTVTPTTTLTGASTTVYTGCSTITTASSTSSVTPSTSKSSSSTASSSTVKAPITTKPPKCRPATWSNSQQKKRDAGFQGPDFTLSNGQSPPVVQSSEGISETVTVTIGAVTVTATGTSTSTATVTDATVTSDLRTVTTVSGCAPRST